MTEETVGHFRQYEDLNPGEKKMKLILAAAPITQEYEREGYAMTLRQLFYQMVSRDLLGNTQDNYDALGDAISDGRIMGIISWTAIEDRHRFVRGLTTFDSPGDVLRSARSSYRIDLWKDQPMRPEVWIEKDALLGILQPVCDELQVDYTSCKGYSSQSMMWRAGQRFASQIQKGQRPVVLYLGDHDPSGIHMTIDIQKRLNLFTGVDVQVIRLGLNMDQIRKLNPPPNYVKPKDARTPAYVERFGTDTCWELDALPPGTIQSEIRGAVVRLRDQTRWDAALKREAEGKDELDQIVEGLDE